MVAEKEKKVKPGAQKKQSKEDVLKALEEKRRAKEEEKRLEEERKQVKQLKIIRSSVYDIFGLAMDKDCAIDRRLLEENGYIMSAGVGDDLSMYKRETLEEAVERKRLWKLEHEEHARQVQKKQEANRLQPDDEEMTEKKFKALIKSVGWNPTTVELDAVLDQLPANYIGKLWIESTLWFRARERGLMHRV
jgi:hypothetical protein